MNYLSNHGEAKTLISALVWQLIDSGKVSVSDVASEVGISSESLEAALVVCHACTLCIFAMSTSFTNILLFLYCQGETTTFSHGLTLKIIKWLQNSVHMHGAQGNVCKGSSGVVQDNKSDGLDTTDSVGVKNALVLDDDKGVLVDVPDFAVTEPARTRSKSNSKILKENNATCATGVTIVQNGEKNMVKEDSNPECAAKEFANESTQGFSPSSSKDVLKDEHGILVRNMTSDFQSIISSLFSCPLLALSMKFQCMVGIFFGIIF
jgi:hypothetical protein